jgi:hypothetical protein
MSNQTPNHSTKPSSKSQKTDSNQAPSGQKSDHEGMKSDHEGMKSGNDQTPERMETFPKPNTIPNKWDLSSFSKK